MVDRNLVVRLRAEVNQAVAGLDKTATAAERASVAVAKTGESFEKSSRRQQDAAGRLRVAEAQLLEVQGNSSAKASQLVAAEEKVAAARREVSETAKSAAHAEQVLQQATEDATKAANDAAAATTKSESALAKMARNAEANAQAWSTAGTTLTAAGGAIVAIGVGATKAGIEFNSLKQTSRAALASVMGSAEGAARQMDKLNEFGQGTWVMRDALIRAQQTMTGFGISTQKVIPYMEALAETVAATGGSNQDFEELARVMGKVQSSGKITAETFNEFGTRGVDAAQLIGDAMGMTAQEVRESVTKGTLDAGEALDALAEGMQTRFEGATEGLRNTFRGAFDNVAAAWRDLSASFAEPLVGEAGGGLAVGGLNTLADGLWAIRDVADQIPGPVKVAAGAVGGLTAAASLAAGGFLLLAPRVKETQEAFRTLAGQDDMIGKAARGTQKFGTAMATVARAGAAVGVITGLGVALGSVVERKQLENVASGTRDVAAAIAGLDDSSASLDRLFQMRDGSALTKDVTDLESALQRTFNRDGGQRFNDWAESIIQSVTPIRGSTGVVADQLALLDEEMARLVESGNPEEAARLFRVIQEASGLSADEMHRLSVITPEYEAALEAAGGSAASAADGIAAISEEAVAAQEQLNAMFEQVYASSTAFVDFAEKAVDADVSMRDWIKSMEEQVAAQETWHENLQTLIDRGAPQALIDHFRELGVEGAFRVEQLANASESDLQRAGDAFINASEQAASFAGEITQIPDINLEADDTTLRSQLWFAEEALAELHRMKPTPETDLKITALEENIRVAKEQLGDLDNDEAMPKVGVSGADSTKGKVEGVHDALVKTDNTDANPSVNARGASKAKEDVRSVRDELNKLDSENPPGRWEKFRRWADTLAGGKDYSNRRAADRARATGGAVIGPGTGTSDDIPVWLSNGEHVWTAEEVKRAGGQQVMYAMRQAVMSGGAQAFASGGAVGSARGNLARAERDLERIQNRGRKLSAADRDREAAQKRVESARAALQRAEESERKRAEAERKEAERRTRVRELQSSLRTDVRRGSIRDQVTGGLSGGYSAVDRLFGLGGNEDLSRSSRNRATSSARRFESDLRRLYGQAERVEEKLKDAQETAKELEGIQSSVASSISRNAYSLDVTSQWSQNAKGVWSQTSGVSGVRTNAAAAAARAKELATKLGRLQKMGYAGAILQEVAQAGSIDASIEMADALLEGTGADVKSINTSYSSIEKYAAQAGKYVTGGFYKGGVDAAQGVVKGLESQQASIEKQIESLAKGMEVVFKQVLGIRSPSRVMAELGEYTVEGLVRGMLSGQSDVTNAASLLAGAAVPAIALDVKASPVMDTDALAATSAMQDMSAVTLQAMQMMRADVAAGWDSMLSDTQSKQFSMRDITEQQQEQMRAVILGKQTAAKDSLTSMQESMRSTVADRQLRMRDNIASQQESMRSVMADKQTQMRDKNRTEFESMRATTGEKLTSMRSSADTTMTGFKGDYDSHMGSLKRINRDGHASMEDASESAFKGIRSGMNAQMREAKPELGGKMNSLIDVLAKFTKSVNKAFGDVGVDLSSPQKLSFATGGVMPGYTPGRDVHSFYSPTAGSLYLSGGEAIMRPEFTRAVGGERGVKELNDAARRGDHEHLSLAMHFAQGGVIPASAPARGINAFADSGVWRGLWSIVRGAFPQSRLTSAYRGGSRTASGNQSYHSRGMAVDLAGRYQMDTSTMGQIAEWLVGNYGGSNEIIYSPLNGRQVKNGRNYMYTGAVRGMHYNHVHWANQSVPGGATGGPSGAWDGDVWIPHPFLDKAGVSADGDLKAAYERAAKKQISAIIGKHTGQLSGGEFSRQLGAGIMRATRDGLIKKATDYGELMGDGGIPGAANGPVKQMAREVLEKMGWGDQWADLDWLVTRESGWNPNAQNPTSTAYGLFQFLNGTWGSVGATKTSDPLKQIQAGLKYIQQRYGDVRGARRFWERNNWYKDGTKNAKSGWAVVGEEGPELVNLGGGERIESNPQTRKALAANRTFLPTQTQEIDFDKLGAAIAKALPNQDIAAALNGAQMTLNVDGKAMTGFVHTAVASGYSESRSRLYKSSSKVGAR